VKISHGRTVFDVNMRTAFAFRENAKGYKSLATFSIFMNMPLPITKNDYRKGSDTMCVTYSTVAEASKQKRKNASTILANPQMLLQGYQQDNSILQATLAMAKK